MNQKSNLAEDENLIPARLIFPDLRDQKRSYGSDDLSALDRTCEKLLDISNRRSLEERIRKSQGDQRGRLGIFNGTFQNFMFGDGNGEEVEQAITLQPYTLNNVSFNVYQDDASLERTSRLGLAN